MIKDTRNPVPVMKTSIPCAHILTGRTCSHSVYIAGNLFSKQVPSSLHAPFSTLYRIAVQCMILSFFLYQLLDKLNKSKSKTDSDMHLTSAVAPLPPLMAYM